MKDRAVVSERGTITIPEPIREAAHIHPGDLIEFRPAGDTIILKHLIVKQSEEEALMSDSEWKKFDKLVQSQRPQGHGLASYGQSQKKKAKFTGYTDLEKAKLHSRKLMRKIHN